ncbi:hypothetical protein HY502_00980 [Candidatus Woesebacteria bacterium]|nr:hypothetical protein [Candidatus Woesebacteria bacterium]
MGEIGPTELGRHHIDLAPSKGVGGGLGASERFKGPDGRDWARWMVPNVKEYGAITDPDLKKLVAKVAGYRDAVADEKFLHESFAKIEELFYDGKISNADAALWGERISSRAQDVKEINRYLEASALAEAQGIVGPKKAQEEFRDGEEYLRPQTVISPGNEPRFWTILTEDEKKEVYVRSTLMIIGYKKSMAVGTDKLYMDELRELAVDMNKTAHQRIFKKPGVLSTVGIYSTIIGDPKFLSYKKKDDLSLKAVFGTIINKDPRLKKQFYSDTERDGFKKALQKDYGADILTRDIEISSDNKVFEVKTYKGLSEIETDIREGSADSFYPHAKNWGTAIEEASFRKLKKAIRFWLVTNGRDLLLSDEEKADREAFFGNKKGQFLTQEEKAHYKNKIFKEMCGRARDAEQIAWNYAFATSILETFDSREFRPEGTKRHPPSFYWSLFQWVPFHPQERLEAKIHRSVYPEIEIKEIKNKAGKVVEVPVMNDSLGGKPIGKVEAFSEFELTDTKFENGKEWAKIRLDTGNEGWISQDGYTMLPNLEAKEDWSTLGTWGVYNLSQGRLRNSRGYFEMPDNLKVLPDTLIRGPLFTSRYQGKSQESATLFAVYNGIGNDVLYKTDFAAKDDLFNRINWAGMNDSPFVPFIFDEMRWADVVTNVFKKGGERESKVNGKDLSEAVYNLRLSKKQRDLLLLCYFGIRPKTDKLKPLVDPLTYKGMMSGFSQLYPNYYLGAK